VLELVITMRLVCSNCGTTFRDPGGDPRTYRCSICGNPILQRVPSEEDTSKDSLVGLVAGAGIGAAFGGGVGAIIGGIFGALLGAARNRQPQHRQ
jgi:DNA-directed RNA polymerase subunit RPC12/RpoP